MQGERARQSAEALLQGSYWQNVATIGHQVAEALDYAHGQSTLHRDIKPGNLLLDAQNVVWVADFGLAKATEQDDVSHTNDVIGTLRYMAPERFRRAGGHPQRHLQPGTDALRNAGPETGLQRTRPQ